MTHVTWNGDGGFSEYSYSSVVEGEPAELLEVEEPEERAGTAVSAEIVTLAWWQAALVAFGSLIVFYGVALGSMYVIGPIVHAIDPNRHFDILYVLHNRIVVLVLLVVTVLWVVPPYPSVIRQMERRTGDRSAAADNDTGDGGAPAAALAPSVSSDAGPGRDEGKGGMPTEIT